jgi:hypothetical protein
VSFYRNRIDCRARRSGRQLLPSSIVDQSRETLIHVVLMMTMEKLVAGVARYKSTSDLDSEAC